MGIDSTVFYDRSRIAIVPMGFCFPGQDSKGADLPPRRECAPLWRDRVFSAMPQIELLLAVGLYAQEWHLRELAGPTLSATVADWRRIHEVTSGPCIIPLPHPSWRNSGWLKRHPWFEQELLPFLRQCVAERL
jgi:uracil-DNA glycosylase